MDADPPQPSQGPHKGNQEEAGGTYEVLDLPAGVGVDGEPSLLVLRLDVGVLGGQRVLDLQPRGHSSHLAVAGVGQHFGQFHQEGGLGRERGGPAVTARAPRAGREPRGLCRAGIFIELSQGLVTFPALPALGTPINQWIYGPKNAFSGWELWRNSLLVVSVIPHPNWDWEIVEPLLCDTANPLLITMMINLTK